jgi:hypothetical protein
MSLADPDQETLDGLIGVGDRAEEADLAFRTRYSDRNGDRVFIDIEAQIEVIVLMMRLSVCIHLMNQNAYPAHGEDVLAALATRATRVIMNGNHTVFFNTGTEQPARAISHKV